MNEGSQAFLKAKAAIQEYFPSIVLPNYSPTLSIFDLIESITTQTIRPRNSEPAIQRMKMASDGQQYRIQKSYLEMEKENQLVAFEEICYEMPSTGIFGEKGIFVGKSECELSDMGEKLNNLIDQVWWNNDKKIDESEYFME